MTSDTSRQHEGRRRWLCVAYAFPPIQRSGSFRTSAFVEHLQKMGWDATVLTVEPGCEPVDPSLLDHVPASTSIVRTPWTDLIRWAKGRLPGGMGLQRTQPADDRGGGHGAGSIQQSGSGLRAGLRSWGSRLLMTPDSRIGWMRFACRAGLKAARAQRPEVIYSTSPYESAHLIALWLSHRLGIPWVADFRDPWRANPFRAIEHASLRFLDGWLERLVLRRASYVVCNTPTMRDDFCRRYPFVRQKSRTILNGFDQRLVRRVLPLRLDPADCFVLTHAGQFYGRRDPTPWLKALRLVATRARESGRTVRLQLVGSPQFDGVSIEALARRQCVADCVRVVGQVSHGEALSYVAGSDAVILAGGTGPGDDLQVPNKLFEYLSLRRPILANVAESSPVRGILKDARADASVCHSNDPREIAEHILRMMMRAPAGRDGDQVGDWGGVDRFDRVHRAAELQEVFAGVSRRRFLRRAHVQAVRSVDGLRLPHSRQPGLERTVGRSSIASPLDI